MALPRGLRWALPWLVLAVCPLYALGLVLPAVATEWDVVGRYKAAVVPMDSLAFLRWWVVDRLTALAGSLPLGVLRAGPLYLAYLRALGLQAGGYSRTDTHFVSELDIIFMGRSCVVAEAVELRPGVIEVGPLHLRPMASGDCRAVGKYAVCTSCCAAGDCVVPQPRSLLSGRTGRPPPDGPAWKAAPLVRSRQQPIRAPCGPPGRDLAGDLAALLLSLALVLGCAAVAYCAFGGLCNLQRPSSRWQAQPEGWVFAPA